MAGGGGSSRWGADEAKRFGTSSVSCVAAAMVTNPIDVVKTRMQIRGEANQRGAAGGARSLGFARTGLELVRNESWTALYKGLCASCLREATYSGLRLFGYDWVKNAVAGDSQVFVVKLGSGMVSGFLSAAITTPTDLVKVRMQACTGTSAADRRYPSMRAAFKEVYHTRGLFGLYDGWQPNAVRAAALTGVQVSSYDHSKMLVKRHLGYSEGMPLHFFSSVLAGLLASIATAPIDLVKTRIMRTPGLYRSSLHCAAATVRNEGFFGLYKGFFAQWIRIGPHTLTAFVVLEQLRKLVHLEPIGESRKK